MPDQMWDGPAGEVDVASPVGGPGGITLVEGSAFCISRAGGDISPGGTQGLYFRDTRFLSRWELLVDGEAPLHLAFHGDSSEEGSFLSILVAGSVSPRILVERERRVGNGMREKVTLTNVSTEATSCRLEIVCDSDFADLFEVKEARIRKKGYLGAGPRNGGLFFGYQRGNFRRGLEVRFDPAPQLAQREALFEVHLEGRESWSVEIELRPVVGRLALQPHPFGAASGDPLEIEAWRSRRPEIRISVPAWNRVRQRAVDDLGALRIRDPENNEHAVFAAGIPWFMTVFGRDSIISAWEALLLDLHPAHSTVSVLARHQGIDHDPVTHEAPGKILHEMRFGERADPGLGGAQVYYGSVDATPLFVMLMRELLRFGIRSDHLVRLMPAVEDALDWMRRVGDLDGDGFVEYVTDPEAFLWNQGWKDSHDAVAFADGRMAEGPIALCEVQGYAYAAYLAGAELREHLGQGDPEELRQAAADLRRSFRDAFFMKDEQFFALALDGAKGQVDSVTSNPGHLLWTGILDPQDAAIVARRLLADDMFSGYGIRTLSTKMAAYNPLSYHNGSVWPHDNAIAIAGMLRYGLVNEATRAAQALLGAAPSFGYRLPELFGGFAAEEYGFPVPYPTACSPQAWAAGTPFMLLRAFLGLEPDVHKGVVYMNPQLPPGLSVELGRIKIGRGGLSLRAEGKDFDCREVPPGVEVIRGSRPEAS